MKRIFALQAALAAVLLFLVAVYGARLLERHARARVHLGGAGAAELKPETRRVLAGIRGRASLTYFVSARSAMPSSMKGVEDAVRALLEDLKRAAPDRVDVRVIDPTHEPETGLAYASGKSASPVKVRRVLRDESSEVVVWSSLALANDQYPDALVQGITAADLPYLEDLIVENLKAAANPIQPVIAVAAPSRGHAQALEVMRTELARNTPGARVLAVDFDREARIPAEADAFFWVEPAAATRAHALELERFLASGRSAMIAGSTHTMEYVPRAGAGPAYRVLHSRCDWHGLLRPFGCDLTPILVLDKNREAISWRRDDGSVLKVEAPFQLRILPTLFDTKTLLGPNAGALVVSAVSPLQVDARAVAATGRKAVVVATTSEHARVIELPAGEFDEAALEGARAVPKQPWLVHLRPRDIWSGDLLIAGSADLFRDDILAQGGNANAVFMRTILRTFTHPPRLARLRVERLEPEPLPALSVGSRLAWRAFVVFLVPVGLLAAAARRARRRAPDPQRLRRVRFALAALLAFVVLLAGLRAASGLLDARLDWTDGDTNTPSPLTSRLLEPVRRELNAELIISEGLHMPAALKPLERRLVSSLRALGIRPRVTRPEDLPAAEQARLAAAGIAPFDVETVVNDAPVTARVWSALRLARGERSAAIPELDARAAEHLEFLVASAVKRLQGERPPLIGIFSDLPRLSPAEAHSDYQQKGYTAPVGADVYSAAKRILAQHGYDTAYINPDSPVFPPGMDVLVWLQPRFPQRAYPQFAKFMAEGGKAFIAIQHYNVQQRQHRGAGFKTVYWPQPQFHGFNDYLQLIGVRQVGDKQGEQPGEVLFDRQHASLVLDTQVNRSAFTEHDPQQVSRPFLIRAAATGLSADSVVTSRLGSLLFIWGSRFTVEEEKLGRLGLKRSVLIATSPRTWRYAWSGGWVPDESFEEPREGLLGPQTLAMLLEGPFPRAEVKKDENQRDVLAAVEGAVDSSRPGKLLLVGCSEMFKNAHFETPGFQHAQFLLNAVAFLAHGEELAEIQARTRVPRSFPFEPAGVKLAWRGAVVGLPPALFLLCGLAYRRWRRRPLVNVPVPVPGGSHRAPAHGETGR